VVSVVSYFVNDAIQKSSIEKATKVNFEVPLTWLVWITSLSSVALTFVVSYPAKIQRKGLDLLVRQVQQLLQPPQLANHLQRRGVQRVAAKITQEIGVLFQHHDLDPGPRQQQPQHQPGRAAPGDANLGRSGGGHRAPAKLMGYRRIVLHRTALVKPAQLTMPVAAV
jgi:hypothetical protein